MAELTRPVKIFLAVLVCVLVGGVVAICVLLIPEDEPSAPATKFRYEVSEEGMITWIEQTSGAVKLEIESSMRLQVCGDGRCQIAIDHVEDNIAAAVECFEVRSARIEQDDSRDGNALEVQDCVILERTGAVQKTFWYGGAELYLQQWPINYVDKEHFEVYLSTDLPWRYGNVLERYWLSSAGVAIFVPSEVPLSVSHIAGDKMCFKADYDADVYLGQGYNRKDSTPRKTELRYAVCFGDTAASTHEAMLKSGNDTTGFIERPTGLPDVKMFQDPIWSTWARYKENINQTIVQEFADEIIARNFTNCQLEIDDGYETEYGDFTFDKEKFPDATEMIQSLHEKGFRVTTWVTPFINTRSRNYVSGRINGYFIKRSQDDNTPRPLAWWNGVGAAVDFTNEDAASWYENLLQNVKDTYGLDSFKFDAGETNYVPRGGYTQQPLVNPGEYTTLYAQSAYKQGGGMMEMRSAWRTQSFPFYTRMMDKGSRWGGFKGLRTLIPTALTFGIIGYPYVLPDMVGGNAYGGLNPKRELYIRWLEINAFMPVVQFSISPWDYDEELTEIARQYIALHRTVVYQEILRAAQNYVSGGTIFLPISPIWYLAASDESDAFAASDEFLVGVRYLVAPIVWEGARKRDIYLPRGTAEKPIVWRDMMRPEGLTMSGGQWIFDYRIELHEISWWKRL